MASEAEHSQVELEPVAANDRRLRREVLPIVQRQDTPTTEVDWGNVEPPGRSEMWPRAGCADRRPSRTGANGPLAERVDIVSALGRVVGRRA